MTKQDSPAEQTLWIDTDAELQALCKTLHQETFIAVDTEFHRERTFYAELALVQVGFAGGIALIDPVAKIDLTPLHAVLLDVDVLKVFHAGRQDLEIFFDQTGQVVTPVFDTQVAAALLGLGDQMGYGALVNQICDVNLPKAHGRSDWMHRPIDPPMRKYAADDVNYLRDVYRKLNADLSSRGRRAWLDEEQAVLTNPATYAPDPNKAWERIRSAGRLKGAQCAALQALAAWREGQAKERNRPRKRIISDDLLLDLVKQRPSSEADLSRLRGLGDDVKRRHGKALIALLLQAFASPAEDWPKSRDKGRNAPVDTALVDALGAVLTTCAKNGDIAARLLASRADLENAVRGQDDLPLLRGWRKELAGDLVQAFLRGDATLRAQEGTLVVDLRD